VTLKGDRIAEEFQALVEAYVRARYGGQVGAAAAQRASPKEISIKAVR